MTFVIDTVNKNKRVTTEDITVFKKLEYFRDIDLYDEFTHERYCYNVDKLNPAIDLLTENGFVYKGYLSYFAPEPGFYKFIIPKGSEFYYSHYDSFQFVSNRIQLVSEEPLTAAECIEICNFPKTYVEACERLGINPLNEAKLIEYGLTKKDVAFKKLQIVIESINMKYGTREYDWENSKYVEQWYGVFLFNSEFSYQRANYRTVGGAVDFGTSSRLYLPFKFAVDYVCSLNSEFANLWRVYMQ
jgi:hypothetical protein